MNPKLAELISNIINKLHPLYENYREDYPLDGAIKFSDFVNCNERAVTQVIEECIQLQGIDDAVVKFLITNIQDVAFEGARPLYAHGYTIYEELYYLVSLASHFYD